MGDMVALMEDTPPDMLPQLPMPSRWPQLSRLQLLPRPLATPPSSPTAVKSPRRCASTPRRRPPRRSQSPTATPNRPSATTRSPRRSQRRTAKQLKPRSQFQLLSQLLTPLFMEVTTGKPLGWRDVSELKLFIINAKTE